MGTEHYARVRAWQKKNPIKTHLYRIKSNCKKKGIEFDITEEDVVVPNRCPVLDIPIQHNWGGQQDDSPSIDRIDPNGGYTKNNIIVVSWKANRLKSNADVIELVRVAAFYHRLQEVRNAAERQEPFDVPHQVWI